jgi:NAD+ kinase
MPVADSVFSASSHVAFLLKRDEPATLDLCLRLVEQVRARGLQELVIHDHHQLPPGLRTIGETEIPDALRLLVVLGGDGSMLYGAGLLGSRPVPLLGINLGHLGFLTCGGADEAEKLLAAALDGTLSCEERRRLHCRIYRRRDATTNEDPVLVAERSALNDVVLSQPAQARLFELEAFIDGDAVTTYRADGLIISTSTGSTAYNLAVGGPILVPGMEAVVLSPICPHTLTARPLVTRLSSRIEVRPGRGVENILLTIDGQWTHKLTAQDVVEVTCAATPVRIYRPPQRSFFDLLRIKLHWGVRA